MIFIVRTTVGREKAVIDTILLRAKNTGIGVLSVFKPDEIKGYIFVEAEEIESLQNIFHGIPHIRGMIKKPVKIADIKKFLEAKKTEIKISYGDIIEITGGAFKNERGKVIRIDEAKEEVTIELLEAAIPIPITIPLDSIRVVEKAEKKE